MRSHAARVYLFHWRGRLYCSTSRLHLLYKLLTGDHA
jgi:hypothetical protein